jgi:Ala-tRNA(Pro) deacylase
MSLSPRLTEFLDRNGVPYEHHEHPTTYTAAATASSLHVPKKELAKSVIIVADGRVLVAVLPADEWVDLDHLRFITRAENLRLATEQEFADAFPGCDPGAAVPFGVLFGLPTYCDSSLGSNGSIEFVAGSHNDTIRMNFEDFKRLASPTMVDLSDHKRRSAA